MNAVFVIDPRKSNLARVIASDQGGAGYLLLQDEVASAKTSINTLRTEMCAELGTLREGLQRLLTKEGLGRLGAEGPLSAGSGGPQKSRVHDIHDVLSLIHI